MKLERYRFMGSLSDVDVELLLQLGISGDWNIKSVLVILDEEELKILQAEGYAHDVVNEEGASK